MPPPKPEPVDPAAEIDAALERVSSAGDDVEDVLRQAEADIKEVFVRRHNELAPVLLGLDEAKADLVALAETHGHLFVSPRSRKRMGVQVAKRKSQDDWKFDADVTAARIREHRPDLESAISVETKIDKKKLAGLPASALRKLGVVRTPGADSTTVKRLRDDLDARLERVSPWL